MKTPSTVKPGVRKPERVTLKTIAEHLQLTPGTVSAALNNSAAARSIPEHTKQRILTAARELNYRPNFFARSLRLQRTYTIGVIAEEIGDAYGSMIISGIEQHLRQNNFLFLTVIHRHDKKLLQTYSQMLQTRNYCKPIRRCCNRGVWRASLRWIPPSRNSLRCQPWRLRAISGWLA